MFIIIAVVIVWAFYPPEMISYFTSYAFSVIAGTLIVPVFAGFYSRKGTKAGCLASMLTGGLGTLFWYIVKPGGNYILGCPPFVAGAILSAIVFFAVSKFTTPLPKEFVDDLFSKEAEEGAYASENIEVAAAEKQA